MGERNLVDVVAPLVSVSIVEHSLPHFSLLFAPNLLIGFQLMPINHLSLQLHFRRRKCPGPVLLLKVEELNRTHGQIFDIVGRSG
jgi:hypothetical protein